MLSKSRTAYKGKQLHSGPMETMYVAIETRFITNTFHIFIVMTQNPKRPQGQREVNSLVMFEGCTDSIAL